MDQKLTRPMTQQAGRAAWRAPSRWLSVSEPYLYLLPALLSVALWIYWPLLQTVRWSFYQWNLLPTSPMVYVGLENYRQLLSLPELGRALLNTGLYIVGLLPFSVLIPMALALFTSEIDGKARTTFRALIFLPMIIAPVVVAVVWRWILHPTQGIVNGALRATLGGEPISFFTTGATAIWTIIAITGWKLIGFSLLIFAAGLAGISREYTEAASIDGASRWQIVRHISLPLLSPTISFMVLLTVLFAAQWSFAAVNVLTQGGPVNATTNIYYLLWEFGFRSFTIGWSSAAAVLLFIGFALLAWAGTRLTERYAFYDS